MKTHDDVLAEPEHRQDLADDVPNKDTQMFFDRITRLLHQMSYQISLTVDELTRLMNVQLAYFTNLESLTGTGKKRTFVMLISEINKEVEDLVVLRKDLDHQRDLLHGRSQKVRYIFTLHRTTETKNCRVLTGSFLKIAGKGPSTGQQRDCSPAT